MDHVRDVAPWFSFAATKIPPSVQILPKNRYGPAWASAVPASINVKFKFDWFATLTKVKMAEGITCARR